MSELEQILKNAQEVITQDELAALLESGEPRTAYIGLEPSGLAHVGWKILSNKLKDLVDADFQITILLADWHAFINDKLQSDMDNIRVCSEYMKDYFEAAGLTKGITYKTASEVCDGLDCTRTTSRKAGGTSFFRLSKNAQRIAVSSDSLSLQRVPHTGSANAGSAAPN